MGLEASPVLGLGQGARLFFWSCFDGAVPVLLRKISLLPFRLAAVSVVPALRAVFAPLIDQKIKK